MTKEKRLINEAFGEVSALFMTQNIKGTEMIMPTEDLIRISDKLVNDLNA